jgi:glycosyltransferase involved in cell wall biosynthesis
MGLTPTLLRELRRADRPDVAHVFGFRDPIGLISAGWFRGERIPYVFEALGMFRPKLRKLRVKRLLDSTILTALPQQAAIVVAASEVERREYLDAGVAAERIAVRPNGIPEVPRDRSGELRRLIGIEQEALVLYAGRIAEGKGLDLLVRTLPDAPSAHLALVGPDDGHGTPLRLRQLGKELGVEARLHLVGQWPIRPLSIYADADVFALPSAHENFGMAAAEAASAGVAVVVTDRCGVAEILDNAGALVVPFDPAAVRGAITTILDDGELRRALGKQGAARTADYSWRSMAERQEAIYHRVVG